MNLPMALPIFYGCRSLSHYKTKHIVFLIIYDSSHGGANTYWIWKKKSKGNGVYFGWLKDSVHGPAVIFTPLIGSMSETLEGSSLLYLNGFKYYPFNDLCLPQALRPIKRSHVLPINGFLLTNGGYIRSIHHESSFFRYIKYSISCTLLIYTLMSLIS